MTDFQRLPSQDEVSKYDPRYVDDMKLMYNIYSHQKNTDPVMFLFQQWEQFQENPEAMKAQNEIMKSEKERAKHAPRAGKKSLYPENFGDEDGLDMHYEKFK